MAKRPILPRDPIIAANAGPVTSAWLRFFNDLSEPMPNVPITGNATTDVAALINALIAAGAMKKGS